MGMLSTALWIGVTAAIATFVLLYPVVAHLRAASILDTVSERSSHVAPTPRGGGIALLIVASAALSVPGIPRIPLTFAIALGVLGTLDDLHSLSASLRLAFQVMLSGAACYWLMDDAASALIATIAVVGFVNAFNFMDGINGISGLHAGLYGAALVVAGSFDDDRLLLAGGALLLGLAVGFLPWNFPMARVFLGDSGSYLLGALIALLVVFGLNRGAPPFILLAPGAIYAIDTGTTIVRRLAHRKSIFQAHREHTYQQLTDVLGSHVASALLVAATTTLMFCLALAASAGLTRDVPVGEMALLGVSYLLLPKLFGARR